MTTKEQERKALQQIRKIVEGLGENSYIATAFEGCFEIAKDNIENDFACSMKQRAEAAEKKVATLELDNRDLRIAIKKAKEDASKAQTELEAKIVKLETSALSQDDLYDIEQMMTNAIYECDATMKQEAETIVMMAEHPTDISFQNAVRVHRAAQKRRQYLDELKSRVVRAKAAI